VNASLARSLAAVAYESLLAAALVLVTGFLTLPLVSPSAQAAHALEVPGAAARALSACVVFGIAGLYCVWMWTGGRRTLSMKTWRLWLLRDDGASVDSRTAVIRYLALWIGPALALVAYEALKASPLGRHAGWLVLFNYAWALVDPDRRFLHDRIARTRIVWSSATTAQSAG
jgi:uncharacterized RDD family membrane protein YckC